MNIASKPNPETIKKVNKANRAVVTYSDPEERKDYKRRGASK